jgi:hypothetical protein
MPEREAVDAARSARVTEHFDRMWRDVTRGRGVHAMLNEPVNAAQHGTYGATTQEGADAAGDWATKNGKAGEEPKFSGDAVVLEADVPDGATDEYQALASKLGLPMARDLRKKLFVDALRRNEVVVYNLADVEAYLWQRCKWLNDKAGYDASSSTSGERYTWQWQRAATYAAEDTIPVEAMRVMDQVKNLVPTEQARAMEFQVSKIWKDPDPFLSVSYLDERYVLFHWDEPGFSVAK